MDSVFGMGWSTRERPPGSDEVVQWWGDDIRWCIDTFGPARCMFESNYPVDRMSLGYGVIWNAFQKIASSYTSDEQEDLFVDTAAVCIAFPNERGFERDSELSAPILSFCLSAPLWVTSDADRASNRTPAGGKLIARTMNRSRRWSGRR